MNLQELKREPEKQFEQKNQKFDLNNSRHFYKLSNRIQLLLDGQKEKIISAREILNTYDGRNL